MTKRKSEIPAWEWAIAAMGAGIVLGAIAFFAVQTVRPVGQPRFTVGTDSIFTSGAQHVMMIEVKNHGRTGSNVMVEGTLTDRNREVERAEVMLPFVPARSQQSAVLLFSSDPRMHKVRVSVTSFTEP
jgi:uncharacterized protein (TIGR02588 family)